MYMMLEGDELLIFIVVVVLSIGALFRLSFPRMHRLYFRDATGIALVRIAIVAGMAWIGHVLWHYADPSVVGIYRAFYLIMGFAVMATFGPAAARAAGSRLQQDVIERHNPRAAWIAAGMILATGMIFGGSLWGDADPVGDDEGGWWIPLGFFLAGWFCLVIAAALYAWRDSAGPLGPLRRRRHTRDAFTPSVYLLSCGAMLTESVSGDFYGWAHGLAAVGAIGGMLITREVIGSLMLSGGGDHPARKIEPVLYLLWSAAFWFINRSFA